MMFPKSGGNLYTSNFENDHRCFNHQFCSNDKQKSKVVDNIIESILNDNELEEIKKIPNIEQILKDKITKKYKSQGFN